MASPSIIATTSFEDASNTKSRTINVPAGGTTNDWYAIFVGMDGSSGITISDFTTIRTMVADATSHEIAIGLRKYTGGEGATFTVGSASETGHGVCVLIRGIDSSATTANILDFLSGSHVDAIGNGVMAPRGYCDSADTLLLAFCCGDAGYANTTGNGIPSGYAEVYQDTGISGGVGISLVEADQAATGYSTIPQWTTSNIDTFLGVQLAFRSTLTDTANPAYPPCKAMEIWHNEAATTALKIPLPYGTVEDDGLLFQGACESDHFSIPADFTQVQKSNPDTSIYAGVWEFVADGSMPADYTFTTTGTSAKSGCLKRYTNIDTANFVDNSSVATGTSTAPTSSTITPTVDNCTIDYFFGSDDDDATFQTGGFTGKRLLWVQDNQANADISTGSSIEEQTTKTATGSISATLDLSEGWVAIAVAIAPAGDSGISGILSKTLDAVTSTAAGTVKIAGAFSKTLAALTTTTATGKVAISGAASVTLGNVTSAATGAVGIAGALASTLGNVTLAATATIADPVLSGEASITLADMTLAATGEVDIAGQLSGTLGNVTTTAAGKLAITVVANATLADLTLTSAGALANNGALTATLGAMTISAAGSLVVAGQSSVTLGAVTLSSAATLDIAGSLSAALANVTASGAAGLSVDGEANITLADVTVAAAGVLPITGALAASLEDMTLAATGEGQQIITGAADIVFDGLTLSGTASITGETEPSRGGIYYEVRRRRKKPEPVTPSADASEEAKAGEAAKEAAKRPEVQAATVSPQRIAHLAEHLNEIERLETIRQEEEEMLLFLLMAA